MTESSTKTFPEIEIVLALSKNVFATLLTTLICTLLAWYAQYHWNRRKLYQMAAQINGPLTLPFIGNALYFFGPPADDLDNIFRLTKEFESPVRIWFGQSLYFGIWKANDLETIMHNPNALAKNELYQFTEIFMGSVGLFNASVPRWKRNRKIIMPTFNQKILDEFVEIFSEQSNILLEQLQKEAGKGSFDIYHYVSRCSLDIVCETAMGITVNAQTTESNYFKWVNTALEVIYTRIRNIIYYPDFIFNRTSMAKELSDAVKKINDFTGAVVIEKRKAYQIKLREDMERPEALLENEPRERKPFLQHLIELSEGGANFTDEELLDEVKTFMIAGSDTTASAESFIFIMLGMFPDIQEKVYKEVIDVLGPDTAVECRDLGKLQYLERVIKETLRIFPIGPIIARAVTEDIKLESCIIPAGSSVALSIISSHRDPDVWPDPLKFNPDRFLLEEVAKRHPYSWIPFWGGPRNCVGPKYAMMVIKTLIATVIRKYQFTTDYKDIEDIKLIAHIVLKTIDGYKVSIKLRE